MIRSCHLGTVQDGRFAPVVGESIDGAAFRESLEEVVFGDSADDERCLVFDVFGSAVWKVYADGAGVAGAEGSCPVVDVLQDKLLELFEVVEVEIAGGGLCFELQNALVDGCPSVLGSACGSMCPSFSEYDLRRCNITCPLADVRGPAGRTRVLANAIRNGLNRVKLLTPSNGKFAPQSQLGCHSRYGDA
ncbi:hypothetical protein M2405_001721 [Rhodococcus erythropolis]|nr:hypothetical protein N601_17085 [Rhodococcus erythropolis DN1]MCS4253443.1 hypothetical protein [Rhodococcus erythropolis]MCW2427519.1 hypothetical protein [Rhodococcus erythropolis]